MKRLVDDEDAGSDESEVVARKVPKMEKPTDILTSVSVYICLVTFKRLLKTHKIQGCGCSIDTCQFV